MTDMTDPAAVLALLAGTTEGEWRVGANGCCHYRVEVIASNEEHDWHGTDATEEDLKLMAAAPALARALADARTEIARLREALQTAGQMHWHCEFHPRQFPSVCFTSWLGGGTLNARYCITDGVDNRHLVYLCKQHAALHPAPDGAVVESVHGSHDGI